MSTACPWHAPSWERAWVALHRGAHALLIAGAQGLGKAQFASDLAAARLCHQRDDGERACGRCESCHWLSVGTHPDLSVIEPIVDDDAAGGLSSASPARSKPISVDQIRGFTETLGLTAHRAAGKVVIVRPANALNVAASNALLKNLEEPPPGVVFLLVSDRPAMLLPTVRSRCQRVSVRLRNADEAARWLRMQNVAKPDLLLALSGGAPLQAVAIAEDPAWQRRTDLLGALLTIDADPVQIAERYRDLAPALALGWLQKLTYDLALVQSCGRVRYHIDLRAQIEARADRANSVAVTRLHRKLISMQRIVNHPLNPRLILEQLFIDCASALNVDAARVSA